jgi:hypothetical protein
MIKSVCRVAATVVRNELRNYSLAPNFLVTRIDDYWLCARTGRTAMSRICKEGWDPAINFLHRALGVERHLPRQVSTVASDIAQ